MAQRKLMLPPFHGARMQSYRALMTDIARAEIERWPSGTPFRVRPRMQAVTLEIILRAVFGLDEGAAARRAPRRASPRPRSADQPQMGGLPDRDRP